MRRRRRGQGGNEAARSQRALQATVRTVAFTKSDGKSLKVRAKEWWEDWLGRGGESIGQGRALKTLVKVLAFTLKTIRHQ